MIAQFVIVFYFIVCVGIILFNCFTEIISRYRSCVLKRREQRYCEEYRQLFLDNITENKKQEKRLVKELQSTSRLLTFSEALYKVENSMPEQFQQGIASVSRLMEELIPVYKRNTVSKQLVALHSSASDNRLLRLYQNGSKSPENQGFPGFCYI